MRIYPSLNAVDKIHWRNEKLELQTQFELFHRLIKDGFDVRADIQIRQNAKNGSAFDLVIFRNKKAIAIIEVKSDTIGPFEDLDASLQGLKYRSFGLPVILFWDLARYADLKVFLNGECELAQIPLKKEILDVRCLHRLHKSLDIASMAAWDLGMSELVTELENNRDKIASLLKEAK